MTKSLWSIIAAATVVAGCSNGACYDNQSALPKAAFYVARPDTIVAATVSGLSVSGIGAPGDSLLLNPEKSAGWVYLPFRPDCGQTEFKFASGLFADVVTFSYTSRPYFASEECGAMWVFDITGVSWRGSLIDSVAITDSIVTNIDLDRIKIIFHPMDGDDSEEEGEL